MLEAIPTTEIDQQGFQVDNDQKAEWALRKIAEIDLDFNRYNEVCKAQWELYQQKACEAKERRDNERNRLVYMLSDYFESVTPKATKTQAKYTLPSGVMVKKFEKQEIKHDPATLIERLTGTAYVEQKPNLKWGEYKKTLKIVDDFVIDENGEVVDGVTIEIKPASFDVEIQL